MQHADVALYRGIIETRLSELRQALESVEASQGQAHLQLLKESAAALEAVVADLVSDPLQDAAEAEFTGRELLRLVTDLNVVSELVATYRFDFATGHPLGLLHLAHSTVRDVAGVDGEEAALLLHLEVERNYSVFNLRDVLPHVEDPDYGNLLDLSSDNKDGRALESPRALILNLPAMDPYNVFLAPIMAHEVGHGVVDEELLAELWRDIDVQQLIESAIDGKDGESDQLTRRRAQAEQHLQYWLTEIFCDTLAAVVAGPSWLLAISYFLPAPDQSSTPNHPPGVLRVHWALRVLDRLGWSSWMEERFPKTFSYLKELKFDSGQSAYYAQFPVAMEAAFEATIRIAETKISSPLRPERFTEIDTRHFLVSSFESRFVPPLLAEETPSHWSLLLAGWVALMKEDDSPERISRIVGSRDMNTFLLKVLELAGISELWRQM